MNITKRMIIILRNIFISYVISILLLMVYAFLLAYTNVPESTIPISTFVISLISVFLCSSLSMISIRENGLVNGAIIGFVYVLIIYLLSSIFSVGFTINGNVLLICFLNVIIGMIGGIIGVNIKEERKLKWR